MKPLFTITLRASDVIAIWGGVTGSFGLFISYLTYKRDRADVNIEIQENMQVMGPMTHPYKKGVDYISIRIANKGRRPFTLEKVGYVFLKKTGGAILGDSIFKGAVELTEGKFANYLAVQKNIDFSEINYFAAYDAVGNTYKKYIAPPHKRLFYWFLHISHIKGKELASKSKKK
jgi:hypothetical protein